MPHKDRNRRLAYLRRWKETGRPSPTIETQPDAELPPRGAIVFSVDGARVQCHVCGRWLRSLNAHLRMHDLDGQSYKETYDLKRTASLWPPALQAKQREAAIARDQGAIGKQHLPLGSKRPKGLMPRLQVRVEASEQRKGVYTRGGEKAR